ncbi:RNA polymerase sigma factor [Streptomyces yaanensis]|uniref:RNA polymerase sigma factor n=1 Tax=Streptomyces yaanensis TaxID=1142239 RepID=A0ABV7SHX9_9ACTN|nr:sigma-70 family RNA polymerase sigma factor [Streptomyces sp. CGMCC 4.7035]WNC01523.1 sigma-70 family RNA polymerase sigma factor [Streptomyces sp. CGMCC 4.7035]
MRTTLSGWARLLRSVAQRREHPDPALPRPCPSRSPDAYAAEGTPGIDELYHEHRLGLVRLALLLVDDLPTAEDLVQDAFAALVRRHGAWLTGVHDPVAYVRTSVVNGARSVLRRRRTARAHVPERQSPVPLPEEHVLLKEEHREVLDALRRLTRRQREVLVLRYWSHLSEAQIAETLGLSRGTVKSTASRALDALGRHLGATR